MGLLHDSDPILANYFQVCHTCIGGHSAFCGTRKQLGDGLFDDSGNIHVLLHRVLNIINQLEKLWVIHKVGTKFRQENGFQENPECLAITIWITGIERLDPLRDQSRHLFARGRLRLAASRRARLHCRTGYHRPRGRRHSGRDLRLDDRYDLLEQFRTQRHAPSEGW